MDHPELAPEEANNGSAKIWCEKCVPGETAFITSGPGATKEDDGVVPTAMSDSTLERSELTVLDVECRL